MPVVDKVEVNISGSADASDVILLSVFLLSGERCHCRNASVLPLYVLLGISRLSMIPAFGEIMASYQCEGPCRRSLSSTHFAQKRRCDAEGEKRSAVLQEPPEASLQGRLGFIRLLCVGKAATEEP